MTARVIAMPEPRPRVCAYCGKPENVIPLVRARPTRYVHVRCLIRLPASDAPTPDE